MDSKVTLTNGDIVVDDRGCVKFVNDFDFDRVKRFYQVENHIAGFIRAWHAHKNEGKYIYVVSGSALVGTVDLDSKVITKNILSSDKPSVLWVPPNFANGFKTLTEDCKILFFSTSTLSESQGDDIRFAYDKWDIWDIAYR